MPRRLMAAGLHETHLVKLGMAGLLALLAFAGAVLVWRGVDSGWAIVAVGAVGVLMMLRPTIRSVREASWRRRR